MKLVIRLAGKADKVFDKLNWMASKAGKLTLGGIVRIKNLHK